MKKYPKVSSVVPLEDKRLLVAFDNGVRRVAIAGTSIWSVAGCGGLV
jgi:hypothetical protein